MKEKIKGLLLCLAIAVPAWLLGRKFAVVGGPVISILLGMIRRHVSQKPRAV